MIYENISKGIFINRLTRFTAEVKINGCSELCHIKNTGRLKELLVPGAEIYLNQSDNRARSTKFDLISVKKGKRLINIDSSAPNRVFGEFLRQGGLFDDITLIKPEAKYAGSRFDFYAEAANRKAYIEVKGVTLEKNNIAMFPDAPTERGVKHLKELARCIDNGCEAYVVFIIKMEGMAHFTPNRKMHAEFASTLADVMDAGVNVLAFDCVISENSIEINNQLPVKL